MPWYPQPDQRCTAGFWDGQRWLALQDDRHLMVEDFWVAFDDIVEVSYWSKTVVSVSSPSNFNSANPFIDRGFSIRDVRGELHSVDLSIPSVVDDPERQSAWAGLIEISRRFIEPIIAQRIFSALRLGEQYSIQKGWVYLSLTNSGFSGRALRKSSWKWEDFRYVDVNPKSHNISVLKYTGQAQVWAQAPHKKRLKMVTALDTNVPNAVVLGTLLPMCAAAFGGVPVNPS